jgi:hypothetical protein
MAILPENRPATEEEIDAFLAAFEAGTLPKAEFTHAAHVLTGACFVHRLGEIEASHHMRDCIRRFNEAVGGRNTETSGYHETITVFWIKIIAALLGAEPPLSRMAFAAHAVRTFKDRRDLFREFYDFDVLGSVEARRNWISPSTKAIVAANL